MNKTRHILDRCLQTAKPTAVALGIPIYVEHGKRHLPFTVRAATPAPVTDKPPHPTVIGLSEWYFPVEPGTGLHPRPSSATTLKAYIPEIDDSWSSVWYPSRKGEDVDELYNRLAGFVSAFVTELQRHFARAASPHKRILFVGHAATVIGLVQAWLGDRNVSFLAGCCSITVLDRKAVVQTSSAEGDGVGADGDWIPRVLGSCDHLKDGVQRGWRLEYVKFEDGTVSHRCILQVAHFTNCGVTSTFGALLSRGIRHISRWSTTPVSQ